MPSQTLPRLRRSERHRSRRRLSLFFAHLLEAHPLEVDPHQQKQQPHEPRDGTSEKAHPEVIPILDQFPFPLPQLRTVVLLLVLT